MKAKHSSFIVSIALLAAGGFSAYAADLTWDGGNGNWDTTTQNWDGSTIAWNNTTNAADTALFATGTGIIDVTEDIALAGITVTTTSTATIGGRATSTYLLEGDGKLNFGNQQGLIDTKATGLTNLHVNTDLTGTGGLKINAADAVGYGQGWVTLAGNNSGLSGGITVANGLIGVWDQSNLGSNAIALQGNAGLFGNVDRAVTSGSGDGPGSLTLDNDISISGFNNIFRIWSDRTLTLEGEITGSGSLAKADIGHLVLTHNNKDFSGDFSTSGNGIIRAEADHAFGTGKISLNTASGGDTRLELSHVTISNDIVLNSGANTGYRGDLTAVGTGESVVNGNIVIKKIGGNGGHLASWDNNSTLVLNGTLDVDGIDTITHRWGNVVYAGGGSTAFTFNLTEGTAKLGADDGISTLATLRMSGSGTSTFDLNGYNQTFVGLIHDEPNASRNMTITGKGTLTINTSTDTELGPGGTLSAAQTFNADFSGLEKLVWNGVDNTFRVGLRAGAGNSFTGNTGTFTTTFGETTELTAKALMIGDQQANNSGGHAILHLGTDNTIYADTINVGASNRSNATLDFATGLTDAKATIRGTDGTSAVGSWDVGKVANFNSDTWTAAVDFTDGELDAKVDTLRIAIAATGGSDDRAGQQKSTFTMGKGSLIASSIVVGEMSGTTGNSKNSNTYAADGTFTLDDADGLVRTDSLILANNTANYTKGTRNVSGTFNLTNGTLEAKTISRGTQDGTASNVTTAFNFTSGTIANIAGSDLTVSDLAITLDGASDTDATFHATAGQAITVAANAKLTGSAGFEKTGDGAMEVLSTTNTYTGATTVSAGTLLVSGSLGATAVTVESGAILGGAGGLGGDLHFKEDSYLDIRGGILTMTAGKNLSFGSFDFDSIVGFEDHYGFSLQNALEDTYALIGGTDFTINSDNVSHWGETNAAPIGNGKYAYFDQGSFSLVIIPEPATALLGALGGLLLFRRRRD